MIIVSNTSPLTNLAAIGQFELLKKLFGEIHIALGVWEELNAYGKTWPGSREVSGADWIVRREAPDRQLVTVLKRDLDRGEAESISLASSLGADAVLLDEKDGRLAAQRLGLRTIGVLGILLSAKSKGFIAAVRPNLDMLQRQAGFYLSPRLCERMLELAGE